jgi:protein-arginine kinase activator protein McsA
MNKFICCPNCNCQYLPGEIFDPKHFVGQPINIIRNNIGEILGYEGIKMDTVETFVCEQCNTEFEVVAKVNFIIKGQGDSDTEESPMDNSPIQQVSLF